MKKISICYIFLFISLVCQAQTGVHHYSVGEGEPILLINGGPGWSSYHMQPVADKIADMGYEVILYDQRGTGRSTDFEASTITFENMVEDIEKLREELNLDTFTILGHSFGGMLAMGYSVKYPQNVDKLILSAPGGADLSFLNYYQTNLNYALSEEELQGVAKWSTPDQIQKNPGEASYNIIKNTISSYVYNKELKHSIMEVISEDTWNIQTAGLVWQSLQQAGYNLTPSLHKIKAPTLIMQGRQDALGAENPINISQLIPNTELIFVEESAHLIWRDQPEVYFSTIGDFLDIE